MSTDDGNELSWAPRHADVPVVLDRITDAFFALDTGWRFTYLNERAEELLDRRAGELVGANVWEEFSDVVGTTFEEECRQAAATGQPVSFEGHYAPLDSWFHVRAYPSETGLSVYVRDETERVRRTNELRQFRTLADTVSVAILTIDEQSRIRYANRAVADVFGYAPEELRGESLTRLIPDDKRDRHLDGIARYLEEGDRTIPWEYIELTAQHREGHTFPITVSFSEYEHDGQHRFTGVVRDVSERVERERTLERQHDVLARLDQLNLLVQRVADALVEATALTQIAETVCDRVAGVGRYESAWFGCVQPRTGTVTTGAWSGDDERGRTGDDERGRVGDDERGRVGELSYADSSDAVAEAVRTGDVQVSSPGERSDRSEAAVVGERVAVPVTFEETVYGVLEIRVNGTDEFREREREILAGLGEIVGHAINALERKAALMGEQVQVVELVAREARTPLNELTETDLDLTIERSVPTADGAHLHYVTANGQSPDPPLELAREDEALEGVRVIEGHETGVLFEVRTPRVPLVETLTAHGGNVRSLRFDDGVRVVAEFPHGTDVRAVLEAAREEHPDVELVSQRSREPDQSAGQYRTTVASQLTERQRDVLEAAYSAGYFEWSRESTGEEVADSMGVSSATFHQHLRAAQRKLLEELLEGTR